MHPGELIRARRLALGLEPEKVARQVGLEPSSYYDLEGFESELPTSVSLGEIARLEDILNFDVREAFSAWSGRPEVTLDGLSDAIKKHLQEVKLTVNEFENAIGWEIDSMLANPHSALDWNLDCLRDVCKTLGIPWESINFEGSLQKLNR
jgi:transcriptional regulator with XRE-family HTH domain